MCVFYNQAKQQSSFILKNEKQKIPYIANNIITSDSNNDNFVNILNHSITLLSFEKQRRQRYQNRKEKLRHDHTAKKIYIGSLCYIYKIHAFNVRKRAKRKGTHLLQK